MKKANKRKLERQLEKYIQEQVLTEVALGRISFKELKDQKRLWPKLKRAIFANRVADYKLSLLEHAREFSDAGLVDFSRILYAIYFEHLFNRIVYVATRQKNISDKTIKNTLRFVSVEGKTTWLVELLGLPSLSKSHLTTLKKLFEKRNAFIHYKWDLTYLDATRSTKAWRNEQKSIEQCVTYAKKFETNSIFKGQRSKLTKSVSKLPISVKVGNPINR